MTKITLDQLKWAIKAETDRADLRRTCQIRFAHLPEKMNITDQLVADRGPLTTHIAARLKLPKQAVYAALNREARKGTVLKDATPAMICRWWYEGLLDELMMDDSTPNEAPMPSLTDLRQAVEEAAHYPTFQATVRRLNTQGDTPTDERLSRCGGTAAIVATRLGVEESVARNWLEKAREQGAVYAVRSAVSEFETLWWYEGLADKLLSLCEPSDAATEGMTLMASALASHPALTGDDPVIPYHWQGHDKARLVLVSGENASGKSFVTKQLSHISQTAGYEVCCVSMRQRTGDRMFSAMAFGDERRHSTGQCSVHALLKAFRHARQSDKPCVIILDEPDIGLSESLTATMGDLLVEELEAAPENPVLVVVISHSRDLFRRMMAGLEQESWATLYVGAKRKFGNWLHGEGPYPSTQELRALEDRAHETYRKILAAEQGVTTRSATS